MSLRQLHFLSATLLAAFASIHTVNHLAALGGVSLHIAFMEAFRTVYRQPAIEAILLFAVLFQILSGLFFVVRGWKERYGFVPWAQALSGAYLAFFLIIHVGAVLFGRTALNLDTNFYYAAAGLHVAPYQFFFAPYYFMAVAALSLHLGCAAYWRLKSHPPLARLVAVAIPSSLGLVISLVIVATLAGKLVPVEVPAKYKATYAPQDR